MYIILPIGERVIPVYGETPSQLYMGISKVLTRTCLVSEICLVPKFSYGHEKVPSIYRFSPFTTPITTVDRKHRLVDLMDTAYSAEVVKRTCYGFLFKYIS